MRLRRLLPEGRRLRNLLPEGRRLRRLLPEGRRLLPEGRRLRRLLPEGRRLRNLLPEGRRLRRLCNVVQDVASEPLKSSGIQMRTKVNVQGPAASDQLEGSRLEPERQGTDTAHLADGLLVISQHAPGFPLNMLRLKPPTINASRFNDSTTVNEKNQSFFTSVALKRGQADGWPLIGRSETENPTANDPQETLRLVVTNIEAPIGRSSDIGLNPVTPALTPERRD
ncbi:hypothetical protein JOQ06_022894, partial [Pogonophryne albipinna]